MHSGQHPIKIVAPVFLAGLAFYCGAFDSPSDPEDLPTPTFFQGTLHATKDMCFGESQCRRQAALAHIRCFPEELREVPDPRTSAEARRMLDEGSYYACINAYMEENGFEWRFPL